MTAEEKRIAIAEACGWSIRKRRCPHSQSVEEWFWYAPGSDLFREDHVGTRQHMTSGEIVGNPVPNAIPDYLNDLNAMHQAESTLTPEEKFHYRGYLAQAVHMAAAMGEIGIEEDVYYSTIHADAKYRAQAFLWTKGKWKP